MKELLTNSNAGRMILHLICLLRNPRHARWHWRGILREFHSPAELGVG